MSFTDPPDPGERLRAAARRSQIHARGHTLIRRRRSAVAGGAATVAALAVVVPVVALHGRTRTTQVITRAPTTVAPPTTTRGVSAPSVRTPALSTTVPLTTVAPTTVAPTTVPPNTVAPATTVAPPVTSSPTVPPTTLAPPPTASFQQLAAAQAALPGLLRRYPSSGSSGVTPSAEDPLEVVSTNSAAGAGSYSVQGAVITVYRWSGAAWTQLAVLGDGEGLDLVASGAGTSPFAVDLTGGTVPDFIVDLDGGDHTGQVVVTDFGGTWHLLGVRHVGGGDGPELIDPVDHGSTISESIDNCQPNCASGTSTVTTYRFDPSSGQMAPVGT